MTIIIIKRQNGLDIQNELRKLVNHSYIIFINTHHIHCNNTRVIILILCMIPD